MPLTTTINVGSHPPQVTPDFDSFAASRAWMGQKIGTPQLLPEGGFAQQFQTATAYGTFGGQPYEVHGSIREKYLKLGGPAGLLGFPTTNETAVPDGKGRFNHFDHGSIYWHPLIGAFETHGAIHGKWASLGWEGYGYPLTDESRTLDGRGRFNHFRAFEPDGSTADGSIYWTPDTGPHEVHGAIRSAWSGIGWDTSFLGYPVSDEYGTDKGRRSDFQTGDISWTPELGAQVQPQRFKVDAPNIVFGTGIAVGGYGSFTAFSDGTTRLLGRLHASGIPSYDCLAVFTLKDSDGYAYTASQNGRVHGSDEPGSRNLEWDLWGFDDRIRDRWAKIRSGGTGGSQVSVTSDWSPQKIAEDVLAVVGIVLAVIPMVFTGGAGKSADPNYMPPEDFPIGGEPPPDSGIQTVGD